MARFMSSTDTGLAGLGTMPFSAVMGRVAALSSQPSVVLTNSTRVPAWTAMSARTAEGMTIWPLLLTVEVLTPAFYADVLLLGKSLPGR